jgi:hypothetical protein
LAKDGEKCSRRWLALIVAAFVYFAIVFFFAFLIGIFRVLVLNSAIGQTGAVLVELPIVLAISWVASGILIRRFGISRIVAQRLAMGAVAFSVTMVAEAGFSIFVFGQSLFVYLESIRNIAGVLGLSGQLAFALIPTVQLAFKRPQ